MQKTQEIWARTLSWSDPRKEEMTTRSTVLAWEIPWTEEPGRLQSMGSQRAVRANIVTKQEKNEDPWYRFSSRDLRLSKEIQSHLRPQNYLCGSQSHLGNQISAQISLKMWQWAQETTWEPQSQITEPQTYTMVSSLSPESLRQFLWVPATLNALEVYWHP